MVNIDDFFLMEKKHEFFQIKTNQGFPIWDIIRHHVWKKVYLSSLEQPNLINSLKRPSFLFLAFNLLKYLAVFIKSLFIKNDILFIGFSRFRNPNNKLYDKFFKIVKETLSNQFSFCFYEIFINQKGYDETNRTYDIIPFLSKIFKISIVNKVIVENLSNNINNFYGKNIITAKEIQELLSSFYLEYVFYKFFIKIKKIKYVFLVSDFKALCFAAKKSNVLTFEIQHGDIVKNTINYSYSLECCEMNKDNFIFPKILFTYSSVWAKNNNFFSRCIELGIPHVNSECNISSVNNNIVIVSSPLHNDVLMNFAVILAQEQKQFTIYFKLHPMDGLNFDFFNNYFSKFKNILVVNGSDDIKYLLKISNHFIAIYSTVMYEIYQAKKYLYIFKKQDFQNFSDYFFLDRVSLFSDYNDFQIQLKCNMRTNINSFYSATPCIFFKEFQPEILINSINQAY